MGERCELVNMLGRVFFWTVTILLGFLNPLFSVVLVVMYYLPKIIQDICHSCDEDGSDRASAGMAEKATHRTAQASGRINSFSKDVLEKMR